MVQQSSSTPIYRVSTEGDVEARGPERIIGYATGDPENIKSFFDDQKYYTLFVKKIEILEITQESAAHKCSLVKEKNDLEQRLAEINRKLGRR